MDITKIGQPKPVHRLRPDYELTICGKSSREVGGIPHVYGPDGVDCPECSDKLSEAPAPATFNVGAYVASAADRSAFGHVAKVRVDGDGITRYAVRWNNGSFTHSETADQLRAVPDDGRVHDPEFARTLAVYEEEGRKLAAVDTAVVTIPLDRYMRLYEAKLTLDALHAAGVDNWDGYGQPDWDKVADRCQAERARHTPNSTT